ncbi:unnamed protein product, partial [Ectocarpus sp. 12 AP-2014]
VYGVARVLQESGDHAASRELLLFLGERSQELSGDSSPSSNGTTSAVHQGKRSSSRSSSHQHRLCFPLEATRQGFQPGGGGGVTIGGGSGGASGLTVLPVAPAEVMWRVARASMAARDWPTAILALEGLVAAEATADGVASPREGLTYYFASFAKDGGARASRRGPGRARVLRALAFSQIQRGLYRDALETVGMVLGDGSSGGGGSGEEEDAAMLMLRADALLCLEEDETCVGDSLDRALRLLTRRQVDLSVPPPPPPPRPPPSRAAAMGSAF